MIVGTMSKCGEIVVASVIGVSSEQSDIMGLCRFTAISENVTNGSDSNNVVVRIGLPRGASREVRRFRVTADELEVRRIASVHGKCHCVVRAQTPRFAIGIEAASRFAELHQRIS